MIYDNAAVEDESWWWIRIWFELRRWFASATQFWRPVMNNGYCGVLYMVDSAVNGAMDYGASEAQ